MTYEDLLKQTYDELPTDKLIPNGTWRLRVHSATFQKPKTPDGQSKWFMVIHAKEAMDDVDLDAVQEAFPDSDFSQSEIFLTFWFRKPSDLTRMINFMSLCGVVIEKPFSAAKVNEHLKALKGTEFMGLVGSKTRTDDAGESVAENTISKFATVED